MEDDWLDPWLSAPLKGYPGLAPPLKRSQIGHQGWNVLAGDLPLPLATLRRAALSHNLRWMQRLVDDAGIALAPHGKTTMSPQLFRAQVDAGAWGITFASVQQLAVGMASGVRRALIANQVFQVSDLNSLAALLHEHAGARAPFLLDSPAQLRAIERANVAHAFEVLIELGLPSGRTGVRGADEALELARLARASHAVRLAGVESYEGLWATGDDAADAELVGALSERLRELTAQCEAEGLFETSEVIVSVGGSAVFDLAASALRSIAAEAGRGPSTRPRLALLRSGCYVTHDDGAYRRYVHSVNRRMGCADETGLTAAVEVWAAVQSCPEPGLAILNAGKRDLSADWGMPVPVRFAKAGAAQAQPAPAAWSVEKLNDQHAYLKLNGTDAGLSVGDRVALGISHPCTTFDKWRWMAVIDETCRVVDAVTTFF